MIKINTIFALEICVVILLSLTACSKKEEEVDKQAFKMNTIVEIKAYGSKAGEAIDAAFKRIDEIEQMASSSIETSDVSKINSAAGQEYVKVHPEIIKMIKTAVTYSKLSNGAFDITVGPLVKLWGIDTADEKLPSDSEIKAVLPLIGYKNISIKEADNSIMLMKKGMSLDMGGIAKGYVADETVKILKDYGIKNAIINLGGSSVYTLGQKPDGSLWSVAVRHPRKDKNNYAFIIRMPEQALSTSGDYERYFIKDGKRYHHILNPFDGYPADTGVMSDTIVISNDISGSNMLADILTKITFVSGIDKGFKIIDSIPGVECIAITTDQKIYKSSGWKHDVEEISPDFTLAD
jgi:FAD:protein FMN transferase